MPMVHQGYIEPHVAVAQWGEDGRLTLWTSTQGAFHCKDSNRRHFRYA